MGKPGSQGLKSAQEHPGDYRRAALARASVSPFLSLVRALGVSLVPSSLLVGGWLFSPSVFFFLPLPLPHPSDRSAPPAPCSSGREEFSGKKKFPRSLDQREDGKAERKREREERKREGGGRERERRERE